MPKYTIAKARVTPEGQGLWEGPAWGRVTALEIKDYHPMSTSHRPKTWAKLVYDEDRVYLIFRVDDKFVRATRTQRNSNVCRDSCVEFFVTPKQGRGYFNFEYNAGGTMLLHYNETPDRKKHPTVLIPQNWRDQVPVYHSLPRVVNPEIKKPTTWYIETSMPFALFEKYVGKIDKTGGAAWLANLYKCGVTSTHTHWATWAPLGEKLNFHRPETFAPLVFGKR